MGATELIDFLTYRVDRAHRANRESGLFTCGQSNADFLAAIALRRHGAAAVPAIEAELTRKGFGRYWLSATYASIRGRQAFPVLRELASRMDESFDEAIAVALDLTSYVSTSRPVGANISCVRGFQPRDALDRVVLGVLRGDRTWLASGVDLAREGEGRREWGLIVAGIGSGSGGRPRVSAVGYRLAGDDSWSDPPVVLTAPRPDRRLRADAGEMRIAMQARFHNERGEFCGEVAVQFQSNPEGDSFRPFLVDQASARELVPLILKCSR